MKIREIQKRNSEIMIHNESYKTIHMDQRRKMKQKKENPEEFG